MVIPVVFLALMDLLQVDAIVKRNGEECVLNNISFGYTSFRRLAIAGETGSGKTTLLKIIAGLIQPDGGNVLFQGQRILGPDEKLLPGHPRIAYLSQHFELRNNYKVGEFLEMASRVEEPHANRIYALCQIDHLLHRKTDQLSGGERQRTALARLLITSPRLLLLDEPFSNLDGIHKQVLKTVLKDLSAEENLACIIVSHDPHDLLPWAEDVLVLQAGCLIQSGAPETVYNRPVNAYTGALFGGYNLLSAQQAAMLFGIDGIPEKKQLFIRPENITLQPATGNKNAGTVSAVQFLGSFDEVLVDWLGVTLTVKTSHGAFQTGDVVGATVKQEKLFYLQTND